MIKIFLSPILANYTTIGLGGEALALIQVLDMDDLTKLPENVQALGGNVRFLGGGSNILAGGNKHPFVLVQMGIEKALSIQSVEINDTDPTIQELLASKNNTKLFRVEVGAGNSLSGLLKFCAKNNLQGLEGLVGVPGKVGGAISMNAGAFACEMAHVLESVTIYTDTYGVETFSRNEIDIAYRHFSINDRMDFAICHANLLFQKGAHIQKKMKQNFATKKKGQPIQTRTAGCIFKNPKHELNLPKTAGELLDKAGLKGKELGGMRFSTVHANFLENTGSGTSAAALELISIAKESVKERFSITLIEEVCIWL